MCYAFEPASQLAQKPKRRFLTLALNNLRLVGGFLIKKTKRMRTFQMTIDKETAKFWLSKNEKNRNLNEQRVLAYARQMNEGLWLEVGDTIRFEGEYDRLLDGQHRLSAFIKSNLNTMIVNVVTGLKPDAFKAMDIGTIRSTANILQINGALNASTMSSIVYAILNMNNNLTAFKKNGQLSTNNASNKPTAQEVIKFIEDNPEISEITNKAAMFYNKFRAVSKSEYGAFYYLFSKKNQQSADDFFDQLTSGLNLTENSPIYQLRKKLEQDKMSGIKLVGKMRQTIIITCWNTYRKGMEMKMIRASYDNDIPAIL